MSDYERGPYSPSAEPPLAFDPRRPVRGAGPAPITLIVSAVVLIGLIGGVAWLYRGGFRHGGDAPAPVGAPLTDIKAPAAPDASTNDAAAGITIYKTDAANAVEAANAAAPTFAAPPEQPQPRQPVTAVPAPAAASAPAAAATVAPPSPPPAPVKAVAKPVPQPQTIASLADSAKPYTPPSKSPTKAVAKAAAVSTFPASPVAAAGAGWVQIGAFSSPAQAEKGWTDIAKLEPAAMAGKGKRVEPLTKDGAELYRTYITGFPGRAEAEAFCARLKAAGKSCFVK